MPPAAETAPRQQSPSYETTRRRRLGRTDKLVESLTESTGRLISAEGLADDVYGKHSDPRKIAHLINQNTGASRESILEAALTAGDYRLRHFASEGFNRRLGENWKHVYFSVEDLGIPENEYFAGLRGDYREQVRAYPWEDMRFAARGEDPTVIDTTVKQPLPTTAFKAVKYLFDNSNTPVIARHIDEHISDPRMRRRFSNVIATHAAGRSVALPDALTLFDIDLYTAAAKVDRRYYRDNDDPALRDCNVFFACQRGEEPSLPTQGIIGRGDRHRDVTYVDWIKIAGGNTKPITIHGNSKTSSTSESRRPTPLDMPPTTKPLHFVPVPDDLISSSAEEQPGDATPEITPPPKVVRRNTIAQKAIQYCMDREGIPVAWVDLNPHVMASPRSQGKGSFAGYLSTSMQGKNKTVPRALAEQNAVLLVANAYIPGRGTGKTTGKAYMSVGRERYELGEYSLPNRGRYGNNPDGMNLTNWQEVVFGEPDNHGDIYGTFQQPQLAGSE